MKLIFLGSFIVAIIVGVLLPHTSHIDYYMSQIKKDYQQYMQRVNQYQLQQEKLAFGSMGRWEQIVTIARRKAKEEDFPLSVILAQAALESGHGTSEFCVHRNNCFGMNANDWNPNEAYSYDTLEDGITDYIHRIKKYYPEAYRHRNNPYTMVRLIKEGGYASNPNYVTLVTTMPEFINNL